MNRARKAPTRALDAAVEALARGDHRELVELLREAWRETRDPQLARIYELLVRELRGSPLAGADPAERAASWRERVERAEADPRALPILLDEPWDPSLDEGERLAALERWSPDPLLAAALALRLRIPLVPPDMPGAGELQRRTLALLEAQRDPRQLSTVEWLRAEPYLSAEVRGQVRRTHAALAAVGVRALPAEDRPAMAALARRASPRAELEARSAELLAAVHAEPDRDEPRLIYADWLSTHGDPRGEFITLQIERSNSGAPVSERERELLRRHGPSWAGVLHGVLGPAGRVFEGGFLGVASVEVANLEGEVVDAGEWSTLRVLDGHVSDALARRGPLDHLRELYGFLELERFVALRADNRLAAVEVYECSLADPNLPLDTPLGLRALLVRRALDEALIGLCEAPAIGGLETLGVYYGAGSSTGADHRERVRAGHRYELLRERLPAHVRRLRLIDGESSRASRAIGWTLSFERDAFELFSRLRVDWRSPSHGRPSPGPSASERLLEVLEGIGLASLRRLTLGRHDEPERGALALRLRELAERSGCDFFDDDEG